MSRSKFLIGWLAERDISSRICRALRGLRLLLLVANQKQAGRRREEHKRREINAREENKSLIKNLRKKKTTLKLASNY